MATYEELCSLRGLIGKMLPYHGMLLKLDSRVRDLQRNLGDHDNQHTRMAAMLRRLQYSYDGCCPICLGNWETDYHSDDCELAALLAELGESDG